MCVRASTTFVSFVPAFVWCTLHTAVFPLPTGMSEAFVSFCWIQILPTFPFLHAQIHVCLGQIRRFRSQWYEPLFARVCVLRIKHLMHIPCYLYIHNIYIQIHAQESIMEKNVWVCAKESKKLQVKRNYISLKLTSGVRVANTRQFKTSSKPTHSQMRKFRPEVLCAVCNSDVWINGAEIAWKKGQHQWSQAESWT